MELADRYARLSERSDIALLKDVSYGDVDAYNELIDRYLSLVSRTSFRILCDREDSEDTVVKVFVSLWYEVLDYDDSFTLSEWLLRKTCLYSRIRITRRRILRIFGVVNDVFVNVSPKVEDQDDYLTKQAWELYCRTSNYMTPLQNAVYALCELEGISKSIVAKITGMTEFRVGLALRRAEEYIRAELSSYDKEKDFDRYNGFLRKVADSITDSEKLKGKIISSL
ncbi:MAG: hypothetical protein J6V17_00330 [Bacteroidales bacterium]|nr:hypothetical protein [Bacteroidales bacterium]